MVTFDSTMTGRTRSVWDRDGRLSRVRELDLSGVTELVVVAAHPDDETLGCGGLIAECSRRGIRIRIVIVTDGAASHPQSPTHSPADLVQIRALEGRAALDRLAPGAHLDLLGYPDGRALENRERIETDLQRIFALTGRSALIALPWRGDGHRDHRIVGEAGVAVLSDRRMIEYPVWMWHWASPDEISWRDLVAVPIDPSTKQEALDAYSSQTRPLSGEHGDEAVLQPGFLDHFARETEYYFESASMPARYFDELYANRSDPWRLSERWYEERKRSITMAALPSKHFDNALEIGCSIGMLTAMLGERSTSLLAVDISQAAVDAARERVGANVTVRQADVTAEFPGGRFDLIVLSEVGYYLGTAALTELIAEAASHLAHGGTFVACHWRHYVSDYPLGGDSVHRIIAEHIGLERVAQHLERDFVLDVYSSDYRSVAEREGLA